MQSELDARFFLKTLISTHRNAHRSLQAIESSNSSSDGALLENPNSNTSSSGAWQFIFFSLIEMILFGILTTFSYRNAKKQKQIEDPSLEVIVFKSKVISLLTWASFSRWVSLLFLIFLVGSESNYESNSILYMLEFVCITLPTLLWMPAYLFIILFFAKLYYFIRNSTGENIVRPLVTGLSWAIFILYGVIFIDTCLRDKYDGFPQLSCAITSVIYLLVAFGFGFFGAKLYNAVKEMSIQEESVNRSLKKILILCFVCTVAFIIRAFYDLLIGLNSSNISVISPTYADLSNSFMFFVTELVPGYICYRTFEISDKQLEMPSPLVKTEPKTIRPMQLSIPVHNDPSKGSFRKKQSKETHPRDLEMHNIRKPLLK